MRRLWLAALLLLFALPAHAQLPNAQGWCEAGAQPVVTSGLTSTTLVQASFPSCTVSVNLHGGGTATIFSTGTGIVPLANPFQAAINGRWIFYAAAGEYDITLSGSGFPSPVTYSDVFVSTPGAGGGTVVSFTSGNLSPLFTTTVGTPTSTPSLTFSASQFAAHTYYGNNTGSLATPSNVLIQVADLPFTYSGNTTKLVTENGIVVSGHCTQADVNGNLVDSGGACLGTLLSTDNTWTNNNRFKGPIPWADITAFGARAVGITVYPHTTVAASGCTAGSASVTLTSPGQVGTAMFQNGDGISLFGCGFVWNGGNTPASTPGAPTVTNVVAAGGTALGGGNYSSSINATDTSAQGATTYNYEIVAADKFGGYTAVSTVGSTTTGQATLGLHTCTISTESLSGATITVNFASACYVSPGAMVHISGTSVADFTGWYAIATANGAFTQFTITNTPLSTTGVGGSALTTSSSGGTMAFYYSNHLKWTPVTGAWRYFIYAQRGGSGSYVLVGYTQPSTSVWTEVQWDDYGSPYMDNQTYPAWLPTTAPTSAVADPLTTTIVSGANTTGLTLAATAITSSGGGIATFDDAPGILAACTSVETQAAGGSSPGTCFMPTAPLIGQAYGYPIFSYLKLPSTQIKLAGTLFLHATLEVGGTGWDGYWSESGGGQFSHTAGSVLSVMDGGLVYQVSGSQIYNITISENGTNGGTLFISDGPSNIDVDNFALFGNSNNNDYLSQCILIRTNSSGGTEVRMKGFTCNLGPNQVLNKSWTPAIYIPPAQNGSGGLLGNQAVFFTCTNYCNFGVRGTIEQEEAAGNGGTWVLSQVHSQGLIGPQILFGNSSGLVGPYVDLNTVLLDTSSTGTIASVGNGGTVGPVITAIHLIANSTDVGGIPPPFTGHVPIQSFTSSSATGDIPNYTQSSSLVLPQSVLNAVSITATNYLQNINGGTQSFVGVTSGTAVDLTAQAANITATTLYAVPATGAGFYRFSCYTVITQAATTSGTMPNCLIAFTDKDTSTVTTSIITQFNSSNVLGSIGAGGGGTAPLSSYAYVKASTNIQYSTTGYASSGATPLQYALHLRLEFIGP